MSQQRTARRPRGLFEWVFFLFGILATINVIMQLLAGSRGRVSWLDLLVAVAALYWFGIYRGWLQGLRIPAINQFTLREALSALLQPENSKTSEEETQTPDYEIYQFEISVPHSTEWQPSVAASFMKAFYDRLGNKSATLTIRARHENISWVVTLEVAAQQSAATTRENLESFVN